VRHRGSQLIEKSYSQRAPIETSPTDPFDATLEGHVAILRRAKSQIPGIPAAPAELYRRRMVTLHIEHPITDYSTWRSAFDTFAEARRSAGVVGERVTRPVDDPCYIVVALDFESVDRAEAFRLFLETQVWSSPTASPGLAGLPRTAILQPA